MADPECRWCHRPIYWNYSPDVPALAWNLVYIEYENTRLCDARDMDEGHDPEITHLCPPSGEMRMPCCNKTPFDVPRTDHLTLMPEMVNCGQFKKVTEWRDESEGPGS